MDSLDVNNIDNIDSEIGNRINDSEISSNAIEGTPGDDVLRGGIGSSTITGGDGNDTLIGGVGSSSLTGGSGADVFFLTGITIDAGGTIFIDGTAVTEDEADEILRPTNTIADFNSAEGDEIQLDANVFDVTPGDTSTLTFDNNTGILSLGNSSVVEVVNGVDSDVLANTEIVTEINESEVPESEEVNNTNGILDVYRFFETGKGFHFYTSSETEKDAVQQQIDNNELDYSYEGESFAVLAEDDDGDPLTGAKPVYRFFNNQTGAHLYTISEAEKNNIVDNLADYNLEGIAYYAYDEAQENTIPLYRLYNSETGTHFFTPSASEKDNVIDTLPQYGIEGNDGVAFHVLATE